MVTVYMLVALNGRNLIAKLHVTQHSIKPLERFRRLLFRGIYLLTGFILVLSLQVFLNLILILILTSYCYTILTKF